MPGIAVLIRRRQTTGTRSARSTPSARDTLQALDRLRSLVGAGMPPGDALHFGAAAGGEPAKCLARAARLVERGSPLSQALVGAGLLLSGPERALLSAGETSGTLSGTLTLLCQRLTERSAAKHRVLRALAYPCALLLVTLAVVLAMTTLVLPSFVTLYAGSNAEMPATTRALLALGEFIKNHGVSVAVGGTTIAILSKLALARSASAHAAFDRVLLATPLAGNLIRSRSRSEFYATVACLLRAGVDLENAITNAAATVDNAALRTRAQVLVRTLRRGVPLSRAVVRSGFDRARRDSAMLRLGEAIGDYPGTCERISRLELEDYGQALDAISRIVEPAVLLVMAAAVTSAALAIYQPVLGSAALLMGGS